MTAACRGNHFHHLQNWWAIHYQEFNCYKPGRKRHFLYDFQDFMHSTFPGTKLAFMNRDLKSGWGGRVVTQWKYWQRPSWTHNVNFLNGMLPPLSGVESSLMMTTILVGSLKLVSIRNAETAGSEECVRATVRQYGFSIRTGSLDSDSLASKDCLCSPVFTGWTWMESAYPLQLAMGMRMVIVPASHGCYKDDLRISK